MKVEMTVVKKHSKKTNKDYTVLLVEFEDGQEVYSFDEKLIQSVLERMFFEHNK